ncbi:FMN-binding protein [uncultured Jatrophihabitans sp.]|uniref:FMN-binding protein n=1 Tax=uncultured Jatrophihabitans sp. TaxID=1610747 RepID=UPI0035CC2A5A
MKRLVLSITGTIAGLIALLSFKTETQPTAITGALPAAGLGGQSSSTSTTTNGASSPSSEATTGSTGSTANAAKAYLGSAITTRYGVIQVKVTVRAKKITNVSFAQLTADDGRSAQINSDAAPQLLQETLSAQSANVDTISGASYTSDGYRQSLQSALDKAGI